MKLVDGEFENPLKNIVRFPSQVADIFNSLKDQASETLLVIYLRDDFTGIYDVHSTGASSYTAFDQHDLFGRAYMTKSRHMILVHNHPGGDPKPSDEGREILATIQALTAPLDKKRILGMLDFIIIGDGTYWSWFEYEIDEGYELSE